MLSQQVIGPPIFKLVFLSCTIPSPRHGPLKRRSSIGVTLQGQDARANSLSVFSLLIGCSNSKSTRAREELRRIFAAEHPPTIEIDSAVELVPATQEHRCMQFMAPSDLGRQRPAFNNGPSADYRLRNPPITQPTGANNDELQSDAVGSPWDEGIAFSALGRAFKTLDWPTFLRFTYLLTRLKSFSTSPTSTRPGSGILIPSVIKQKSRHTVCD